MHMSKTILSVILALGASTGAVQAATSGAKLDPNARILACYKEVNIPAKYDVTKILVSEASQKYLRKGGLVYLVEYPAVYREKKRLIEAEHIVMREVGCKTAK